MREKKEINDQEFWHAQLRARAPEGAIYQEDIDAPAIKWLADELRNLADHIESRKFPQVFGCRIPEEGVSGKELIREYRISLSHLWPG